jgi:hypothetical protein
LLESKEQKGQITLSALFFLQRSKATYYQIRIDAFNDRNTLSLRSSQNIEKHRQGSMEFPADAGNSIDQKEQFHSAEGPCFTRVTSLCKQINLIWYNPLNTLAA